jgi:hypothetical protein
MLSHDREAFMKKLCYVLLLGYGNFAKAKEMPEAK